MSLPQPYSAIEEKRVVASEGRGGDGLRGRVGELVRITDDKGIEGVSGSEEATPSRRTIRRVGKRSRVRGGLGSSILSAFCARLGRFAATLFEREEHFDRRAVQAGDRPIYGWPIARFQRAQESRVRSEQHEPITGLGTHLEGLDPGRELLGIQLCFKLSSETIPQRLGHSRRIIAVFFHSISAGCGGRIFRRNPR